MKELSIFETGAVCGASVRSIRAAKKAKVKAASNSRTKKAVKHVASQLIRNSSGTISSNPKKSSAQVKVTCTSCHYPSDPYGN
mgnify:FL=1